jgi:hypothetical protein
MDTLFTGDSSPFEPDGMPIVERPITPQSDCLRLGDGMGFLARQGATAWPWW